MVHVSLNATDEELLQLVHSWLDVLAAEDYERVFGQIGYAMAYGAGAAAIRRDIKNYRSPQYYPGISDFRVSDWRTATGGNPEPFFQVQRFEYSKDFALVAAISIDLPLNGRWSDLEATFVVSKPNPEAIEGVLWLEDIRSASQDLAESDA